MLLRIDGRGHKHIVATHPTTIAFTRDAEVTPRGDCFAAVACVWTVTPEFLAALRAAGSVKITIECGGCKDVITAAGAAGIMLGEKDLVVRKSDWVDGRTLCIKADKAAIGLSRELVAELRRGSAVVITVEV